MNPEAVKNIEPVLTPEQAYLNMILASAIHVQNSLEANGIKPDTILRTAVLLPGKDTEINFNPVFNSWKITEKPAIVSSRDTDKKIGFVLTQHGQILDYFDYGKGLVHDEAFPQLPIVNDGELIKSNIMKNDVIVGLGELCIRYGISTEFLRTK